ncbi:unnamed protein product [Rhodiola kirilowii]
MASNGDSSKKPPTPSPLRNSKFFQANMRILVTGGARFIGSHLVDRLMENEKNEVIVADNYFTGSKESLKFTTISIFLIKLLSFGIIFQYYCNL